MGQNPPTKPSFTSTLNTLNTQPTSLSSQLFLLIQLPTPSPLFSLRPNYLPPFSLRHSLHGSLTNLTINQLSTFTIESVHSNLLFLTVDVSLGLPMLDFAGSYDVGGAIDVLPIYGSGPFW